MPTLPLEYPEHPIELYYEDHGDGRPVVLIHGWPLSGRAWEGQVGPLVDAGYRVITYDRRGFGRSSQPWGGYDYEAFTTDLESLISHLDLSDVALVGFSMGGGEVARYVARDGANRVSRAVFVGAVTPYMLKTEDNPEGGLDEKTIADIQGAIKTDRLAFLDGFLTGFFSVNGKLAVSEAYRRYAVDIAAFASAKGTHDCVDAWGRTDFREDLAGIQIPTLVIHSDADAIVPLEVSGKRTAAAISGAKSVVVKGAPHGFTTSHAAEVNRALIQFLAAD